MVWSSEFDKEEDFQFAGKCVQPWQLEAARANNMLEHLCALHVGSRAPATRLSGLICSIGIASCDVPTIEILLENGMNIACLNCLYGQIEYHQQILSNIRTAQKNFSKKIKMKYPLAVSAFTRGPVIRATIPIGCRVTEIILYQDDIIELCADETYVIMSNNPKVIHINYNNFHRVVKVGNKVNINRRTIHLVCTDIVGAVVVCKVLKGGTVLSGSRVHLPGIPVDMPALNDIDKRVLTFAVESGIDIIFAAYVRDETTVNEIRQFLGPAGKHIMICSEIENLQGIVNIDEIIKASDAIMVARLDLANEIADEKVFLAQRSIISKCNVVGKPVVCTTHLLESMMYSRIPSRSESTDIANAIMNGVDCVMLYHETALGDYPVATVKQAVAMCKQAEPAIWQKRMVMDLSKKIQAPIITTHALAAAAVEISFSSLASAIVITTASMKSAHLLSKYRPKCPIIAVTRNENQARQAHMFRGIIPLLYKDQREIDWKKDLEKRVYFGINFGRKRGFIRPGEPVVIVTSSVQGSGFADKMRIVYVTKHISHGTECIC